MPAGVGLVREESAGNLKFLRVNWLIGYLVKLLNGSLGAGCGRTGRVARWRHYVKEHFSATGAQGAMPGGSTLARAWADGPVDGFWPFAAEPTDSNYS